MRYITRVGRWAYVVTAKGQLYCLPLIAGEQGYPIDADLAADSCRRHAIEEDAHGNHAKAAQYRRAAVALDALDALPEASPPVAVNGATHAA